MKKLLLGAGFTKRDGWLTVDVDPSCNPDFVASCFDLPFESGTIAAIDSQHMFEHLYVRESFMAIKEWSRVMKKGGKLFIETPNIDRCCELILKNKPESEAYRLAHIGLFGYESDIFKNPDSINHFMSHKAVWSPRSIIPVLEKFGFSKIKEVDVLQKYRKAYQFRRDFRIVAEKI